MLTIVQALVWMVERALEVALLAWLMLRMFGPTNTPGVEGSVENIGFAAGYVAFAFVVSGYVFTTAWFSVLRARSKWLVHSAVTVALFAAHMSILAATWEIPRKWETIIWGMVIVLCTSAFGSHLFGLYKSRSGPTVRASE